MNDCVIIPEFGGFVANYKPASVENNRFFPPVKEVAFNNRLISNDGLLINFIAKTEEISYFAARQKLESFVEEMQMMLEENRSVYFDGIGYLHYDRDENLQFEPQLRQNMLVESYGLQSFTFEKLVKRQAPKPAFKAEYREPVHVAFTGKKLKKLAVAVPLLVALALIPMKNHKEYFSKSDLGFWSAISSTPTAPVQTETPEQKAAEVTIEEVQAARKQNLKYFIVGGSFRSEENANKYIEQLKAQGYTGKNLGVYNGLNRVAMIGFATMEEAQKELNSMLHQNPKSGVWIHVNQ